MKWYDSLGRLSVAYHEMWRINSHNEYAIPRPLQLNLLKEVPDVPGFWSTWNDTTRPIVNQSLIRCGTSENLYETLRTLTLWSNETGLLYSTLHPYCRQRTLNEYKQHFKRLYRLT